MNARAQQPAATGFRQPMLATLTERRFSNNDWIFERKFDGMRAIASRDGAGPELWSRNERRIDRSFPELIDALGDLGGPRFIADGEIVAFDGRQTSFSRLQARLHLTDPDEIATTGVAVHYYLFDLLSVAGEDLTRMPLRERKQVLRSAFDFEDPLRYSAHRNAEGEAYFALACERGWEGLIAKRAASRYRPGRSKDWLKFTCVHDQEFVVGGFTDPQGSRLGFGALLLGHYENRRLRYAGKVGTGYDDRTLRRLRGRLGGLARDRSPFADEVEEPAPHWTRPELVVQVGFTEWTADGRLRHPRYLGERTDKPARDVAREAT